MQKVLGYLLVIIGIIVALFFDNYSGTIIPWPWAWLLLGFAISGLGSYVISTAPGRKDNPAILKNKVRIHQLRLSGKRISVASEDCKVLAGYEKIIDDGEIRSTYDAQAILAFLPEDAPKPEENIEFCIIVYKTKFHGKEIKFASPQINKNRETLEFLIANKKEIDLYVDKNDPKNYWFDLEFLN